MLLSKTQHQASFFFFHLVFHTSISPSPKDEVNAPEKKKKSKETKSKEEKKKVFTGASTAQEVRKVRVYVRVCKHVSHVRV